MLSFWEKNTFLRYDYIVVGSGILGLSTACGIKEKYPGKSVLVLERGVFPTGASTKNAGFLCFGSLTEILADIGTKGEDATVKLVESRVKGIELLKKRLGESNMGFVGLGGYEIIDDTHRNSLDKIDFINELLKGIFDDKVFELRNNSIDEFGFNKDFVESLVYSKYEAQIDTGLMMKSLIEHTHSLGVNIINGVEVVGYEENDESVSVKAKANVSEETTGFTAGRLILCTNAFIKDIVPDSRVKPGRGHVLITKPIDGLNLKGIFHYDEGYYYFRNYENRIMLGGGRNLDFETEESTEFEFNERIVSKLKEFLTNVIIPGQKFEIEEMWTGIMGFTENKLPAVVKLSDRALYAISCNGMGIALSSYVAKEIVKSL